MDVFCEFLWTFVLIKKTLTWHWIVITKPSRGLHEQCWHHLWSPQKSVHYNLPKICPRKFTQKEEFLWKKNVHKNSHKMSTRIHTQKVLTRIRPFWKKCPWEFIVQEKSPSRLPCELCGNWLSKTFVICLKKGRTWCS